jgi:aromatic ring-cleaving dioxygenase
MDSGGKTYYSRRSTLCAMILYTEDISLDLYHSITDTARLFSSHFVPRFSISFSLRVYLPNEYVAEAISWMSVNHGEFEVLFHPNTGLMVGDHDQNKRALWIKQIVPLDIDFLVWLQCQWFGCNPFLASAEGDSSSIARL